MIAFFSVVEQSVSAKGSDEFAVIAAAIRFGRIGTRRLAFFPQCALNNGITAGSPFKETRAGAAVEIAVVSVIAFFSPLGTPVAAERLQSCCDGIFAAEGAAVTAGIIRVITLLPRFHDAVAAESGADGDFLAAEDRASISADTVAVIAFFAGIQHSVSAAEGH